MTIRWIPPASSVPWIAAYVATIVAANWAISTFGIIEVGFGLVAPAAVLFAGLAFTFRDIVHETAGRAWSFLAIALGAALSYFLSDPHLAFASGAAFLFSESADLLVYSRLRAQGWLPAVAGSNLVGFTLDSVLFLLLAFGSLDFLLGQLVGKGYMTLLAIAVLAAWRRLDAASSPLRSAA